MSRQRIKVDIQAITREERNATRSQELSEGMDHGVGCVLRARTELKDGKNLRRGVDDQPHPEDLCGAAEPGSNFVQLQMRDVQVAEAALMEDFSVPACTCEPPRHRGLLKAENPHSRRRIQSFGQRREYHCDLVRWGFQTIEWSVATSAERGAALLTAKRLDALGLAMLAIANQRVELIIGVAEVLALLIGTGEAGGAHPLGRSPPAFDLAPGAHRRRRSPST